MDSKLPSDQFDHSDLTARVYTFLVAALILGYYTIIFYLICRLIVIAWEVIGLAGYSVTWYVVGSLAALLALRLMAHLTLAIFNLLTARSDHQEKLIDGVELQVETCAPLYEAVAEIARGVGSPTPETIWVVPFPECYALEIRHFGFRTKRRQLLVLGYPQLQVLNLAEMRVIIAHELAHLKSDTRMVLLIYRFLDWLTKESSAWWRYIDPACWLMMLYSRLFLICATPLLRAQEYQADFVSAKICGSQSAKRTLLTTWLLDKHFESTLQADRVDEASGGDFYQRLGISWRDFSEAGHNYLLARLNQHEKFSFWDTHPTLSQRIERLTALDFPGDLPSPQDKFACVLLPESFELEQSMVPHLVAENKLSKLRASFA